MKIETHSHSYHSFDSSAKIKDMITECTKKEINAIVLNDHDVYNLTEDEENLFVENKVQIIKAIEFTTNEGVHVIGIHNNIKKFQKEPYFYKSKDLVDLLIKSNSWILLPHPMHQTGIIGNLKISIEDSRYCLGKAHFIEKNNYRYGKTTNIEKIIKDFQNLKPLVGSDAHKASDIGVFYNEIENIDDDIFKSLYENEYKCIVTKERRKLYFFKMKIKKTKFYQFFLNKFSAEFRMKIKKKLGLI
jgi:predicted metal-dependent phosphoesterase TrpH